MIPLELDINKATSWNEKNVTFIASWCCFFVSRPGSSIHAVNDNYANRITRLKLKRLKPLLIFFSSPKCAAPTSSSQARRISKSDSVPNLGDNASASSPLLKASPGRRTLTHHRHVKNGSLIHRVSRDNGYLHPGMLKLQRHALSVDETSPLRQDSAHGSQASVTFDPTPEIIDIVPVHKRRERTKRSDTARKHILSRQEPIEKEELNSPKAGSIHRRPSATSENSFSSRRAERSRRASSASRSFDSRCQNPSVSSTAEINDLLPSPERQYRSPRKAHSIFSTPSMEKEFRWDLFFRHFI